jgi:hypothetical protein
MEQPWTKRFPNQTYSTREQKEERFAKKKGPEVPELQPSKRKRTKATLKEQQPQQQRQKNERGKWSKLDATSPDDGFLGWPKFSNSEGSRHRFS